jgi:flavodoxin-like protein
MKALIVYESMFGNTESIARAIADGLGDVLEVTVGEARTMPSAAEYDLVVVGGPTHAFGLSRPGTRQDAVKQGSSRPADAGLREYLDVSPMLTGIAAAAFDTKINKSYVPGSAARKAQRQLRRLGCRMLAAPKSFRVIGTPGPLLDGEAERARRWPRSWVPRC